MLLNTHLQIMGFIVVVSIMQLCLFSSFLLLQQSPPLQFCFNMLIGKIVYKQVVSLSKLFSLLLWRGAFFCSRKAISDMNGVFVWIPSKHDRQCWVNFDIVDDGINGYRLFLSNTWRGLFSTNFFEWPAGNTTTYYIHIELFKSNGHCCYYTLYYFYYYSTKVVHVVYILA